MRKDDENDQDTMTLRDRFAMAALPVVLKANGWKGDSAEGTVAMAYHFANAMLVVRAAIPYPDGHTEAVPTRTAEEERADALAWLKREFERLEDLAECERSACRRDDFQAMSRACNVIANGFEQGAHVGAAKRAKVGAK